jgi:hypothetical protein
MKKKKKLKKIYFYFLYINLLEYILKKLLPQMNKPKNTKNLLSSQLLASFKLIIIEGFLTTTTHALPNIFRTGNIILKIIWLCCFLACGSYCISSMVRTLQDYLTYPSYISTEIIQQVPTKFPAITICNLKTVNITRSYSYLNLVNTAGQISQYSSLLEYMISDQYTVRSTINNDKNLTETKRRELGFEMKDMLISCYYNYKPCDANDFTYLFDPLHGNCYTFNKGVYDNGTNYDIKKLSITGPLYGLILELYLGNPILDTTLDFNDGVLISIHNQSTKPFSQGDQIKAAAGAETDVIVSRNFITKLESPYGKCLKDITSSSAFSSYYFNYIVRTLGETYSHEYCFSLCLQKNIMNKCNCSNTLMPIFNGTDKFCSDPNTDIVCLKNLVNSFGDTNASADCQTACPNECESIDYGISTYRTLYPTLSYVKNLYTYLQNRNISIRYVDVEKAVTKVNIYYKSMEYTITIQKIQTSPEDLFSNIGGTVGLYIGISILSLVEVVELGFNLVLALLTFLKSKKLGKVNIEEVTTH